MCYEIFDGTGQDQSRLGFLCPFLSDFEVVTDGGRIFRGFGGENFAFFDFVLYMT